MSSTPTTSPATIATFIASAGLLVGYAVDGGAYDIIARQQFGLLIWWALFLIIALGLRPLRRPGTPAVLALLALTGLALWAAVSLSWSESDERTLAEVARTLHHLGLFALVLIVAGRRRWVGRRQWGHPRRGDRQRDLAGRAPGTRHVRGGHDRARLPHESPVQPAGVLERGRGVGR